MARIGEILLRLFVAFVGFVGGASAGLVSVGLLGAITGIFGMCSTAPAWWEAIYLPLVFIFPALFGVFIALRVYRNNYPRLR